MIIKNYVVIALRHFWRNKLFAFINVFSLAVGISASLLIFMYLRSEWRYDYHHPQASRIFRIPVKVKTTNAIDMIATNNLLIAPALQKHFPDEIAAYLRVLPIGRQPVVVNGKTFNEDKVAFADQSLLEMLDMPLLAGRQDNALRDSLTVVITEATAVRFFGSASLALGKRIKFPIRTYTITGVLKEHIAETTVDYDIYISSASLRAQFVEQCKSDIAWMSAFNYILLRPHVSPDKFRQRLSAEFYRYTHDWLKGKPLNGMELTYFLQPITDIHLNRTYTAEVSPTNDPMYLYILQSIGVFILIMACINYMNLSTARAGQRAREVGLRKVLGASRRQLLGQFLGESFVLAVISIVLGLSIAEILLPNFNYLADKHFTQLPWTDIEFWSVSLAIVLVVSLLAGLYPAVYLSSFPPTWVLQNKAQRTWHLGRIWLNPSNLRKTLVIVQFALSISLMIGTLISYSQWDYMRTKPLGFQKERVMVIDVPIGDSLLLGRLPAIQRQLRQNPKVLATSLTSTIMDGRISKLEHFIPAGDSLRVETLNTIFIDEKLLPLLDIPLLAGKNFEPTHYDSTQTTVIVNEAFVKKFGWKNPVGKHIANAFLQKTHYATGDTLPCAVVGVSKDFHYRPLKHKIEPLVMVCMPKSNGFMLVKIAKKDQQATSDWVRKIWEEADPKHPADIFMLSKYIESRYDTQGKLVTIFGYFSLLAIIISGLGLLGLTSYLTEQRSKEIGIRRVMGASAGEVVRQFATEFVWLVGFAFLLASPVAYTLMLRWLRGFAYHANPHASHFLLAGLSALFIAVATVSWLTWRVARRAPSIALRYGG